ncbi:hypothetical protein LDENG_00027120 [Lucifuga dentata]|nr:hypothetical protein LDENG_00027120 [Lucifuga dentata]
MMNPSNLVHKNLSLEESFGSDEGSEVSLEPETDRFGFILTNGSTAGVVGPPPELVRQREAKWIHIISQWDHILQKKTSRVKVQCQKGIPTSLRAKCWPLLCGATDRIKHNIDLYKSLDSQPALQSWVDVIERDLDRQFPFHEMFLSRDGHGQRGLFRVLKVYTQHQPEEGYCQGQGPVAAVLLMNMPAEEAFWCLVQISKQYLPGYYSPLLEGVLFDAAMLTWVLKRSCPAAHRHLQQFGIEPLMFATDWLMCLFTRHLPFNTLLRVWDLFFCHGVRVLFQVAVVLVRLVLGRAEQRKQCQGQMETLERLRGVREQVQQEDDTFIAEVCSVPLSARDLERQTEKELEKWRKDRPSSTFDPRGRCHGYQMVWAKAQENEKEQDRRERERGNLSVPLVRSASALSLSPSLLHKRWRKGGKVNEWKSGGKVVRKFSMGAREKDWKSLTDLRLKKVQHAEENVISEEYKKQSKLKLTGQSEKKSTLDEHKSQTENQIISIQHVEAPEKVNVKPQTERAESKNVEDKGSQSRETEKSQRMSKVPSKQTDNSEEDGAAEAEPSWCPAKPQTVGHTVQEEELDSNDQSQVTVQQSHKKKDQETEIIDTEEEVEKLGAESVHVAAMEEKKTEIKKDADTDTKTNTETQLFPHTSEEPMIQVDMKTEEITEIENVQVMKMDTVTEIRMENELQTRTETSPGSQTDREVQEPAILKPDPVLETREMQGVITQTDKSPDVDTLKQEQITLLGETEMKDNVEVETHIQTETGTLENVDKNAGMERKLEADIKMDADQNVLNIRETELETLSLTECIQQKGVDLIADMETDLEKTVVNTTQPDETLPECSAKQCEAAVLKPTQAEEEIGLAAHQISNSSICDQTQEEETQTETLTHLETSDSIVFPQNPVTEPDGTSSSDTPVQSAPEKPKSPVTKSTAEEEERMKNVKENTAGEDDVFLFSPKFPQLVNSPGIVCNQQFKDKNDSHFPDHTKLTKATGIRTSSGDFCVRRSSSSRGSRLARRLSEDLFTAPQQTTKPQSTPTCPHLIRHPEVQRDPSPIRTQTPSPQDKQDVNRSLSEEVTGSTKGMKTKQEQKLTDTQKRFGLFCRLRGEHSKQTKGKKTPKMQIPKILIQDFSDGVGMVKPVEEVGEEKLSSREKRRRRREQERREKEEEQWRKKREKELEKEKERARRKPQTRGKSFQVQRERQPINTDSQTLQRSAPYAEAYF